VRGTQYQTRIIDAAGKLRLKNGNTEEKWVIHEEFALYSEFLVFPALKNAA